MINAIRSNTVSLLVLFLALVAQIPHAQTVFYNAGHVKNDTTWILSLVFAIALESAVLMFVIHGWHTFSYAFAASSILVNAAYYDMLPDVFVKILVSVILPVAIACYSHLVADGNVTKNVNVNWRGILTRVKSGVSKSRVARGSDMSKVVKNDSVTKSDKMTVTKSVKNAAMTSDNVTDFVNDNDMSKSDKMTVSQRRAQMSEMLSGDDSVTADVIAELSKAFSVSQRTIRRDIDTIMASQ